MRPQTLFKLGITLSLFYVSVGEFILPQPLSEASKNTRTSINQYLISLFPEQELNNVRQRLNGRAEEYDRF